MRAASATTSTRSNLPARIGGLALIVGALAFMAVFAYLAAQFNYPAVLDGPASSVLPALLATGPTGRAVWALYGFLPLIWLPAGIGSYLAFRASHPGAMLLALQCSLLSAISMMLGLLRWPSVHWRLAEVFVTADPGQQRIVGAIFDGLNSYLGNFLGEFVGELSFNAYFVLFGWVLLRTRACPQWLAAAGILTGILGWIGMFRNLTTAVAAVAAINNYLLPLWMIVLGVILFRLTAPAPGPVDATSGGA